MQKQTTYDIPYSFYGGNREAIRCRDPEVIVWGPAETGKTLAFLWKLHRLAYKYKGAQLAIIRKKKTDLHGTVLRTFTRDLIEPYGPGVKKWGGEYAQLFDYPGGSRIWLGGIDDPAKTLSSERDVIYVNQAEELTNADWEYLTRCVTGRGAVMPYTQLIGDCNPSHGQHWILSRKQSGSLTLFETTHKDNPVLWDHDTETWTEQGLKTRSVLGRLTGARYKRLFIGAWAAEEGAIYDCFDDEKHKVGSFEIPRHWPRVVGIDPYGAFIAALWGAFDPEGKVLHIYREYMQPFGVTTEQHVKNILIDSKGESIWQWYGGGPSERQQRADFAGYGLPLTAPQITDVWSGIDKVIELLQYGNLVIHDNCVNLLSELGGYRRKTTRDGIVTDKIDRKEEYHLCDALRYLVAGLVGRESISIAYDPVVVGRW